MSPPVRVSVIVGSLALFCSISWLIISVERLTVSSNVSLSTPRPDDKSNSTSIKIALLRSGVNPNTLRPFGNLMGTARFEFISSIRISSWIK